MCTYRRKHVYVKNRTILFENKILILICNFRADTATERLSSERQLRWETCMLCRICFVCRVRTRELPVSTSFGSSFASRIEAPNRASPGSRNPSSLSWAEAQWGGGIRVGVRVITTTCWIYFFWGGGGGVGNLKCWECICGYPAIAWGVACMLTFFGQLELIHFLTARCRKLKKQQTQLDHKISCQPLIHSICCMSV